MTNLFERLLNGDGPLGERRRSPRDPTVPNWAFLMWRERGQTRVSPARVLNLSNVGAFVLSNELPVVGQAVRFCLENPAPTVCVVASVVRRDGGHKVGLDFAEYCPYDFFETAIPQTLRGSTRPT